MTTLPLTLSPGPIHNRLRSRITGARPDRVVMSDNERGVRKVPPRDEMYALVYAVVRAVPHGSVATYGQIASMIGFPHHARMVGRALRALCEDDAVPWHRVVNASGAVSPRNRGDSHELQRLLLEAEGVTFDARGRVDVERLRWDPPEERGRRRQPTGRFRIR